MSVTTKKEIERLEKMLGNDHENVKRARQARRAISSLRSIWAAEPSRKSGDISALLQGIEWRWPLRFHTPAQIAEKEAAMRRMLAERLSK